MATEYQKPSRETIEFLHQGLIIFYPDKVAGIFGLEKAAKPQDEWPEMDLPRYQFESYLRDVFHSINPAFCAGQVRRWLAEPDLAQNVPVNLNELVAENEEAKALKAEHEAERERAREAERVAKESKKPEVKPAPEPTEEITPEPEKVVPEPETKGGAKEEKVGETPPGEPEIIYPLKAEEVVYEEPAALGLRIKRGPANLLRQIPAKIRVDPIKTAVTNALPQIQDQHGINIAMGLDLFLQGVSSKMLLDKASGLPEKGAQVVSVLAKVLTGLESDTRTTELVRQAMAPVESIEFLEGPLTVHADFIIYSPGGMYYPEQEAPSSPIGNFIWSITQRIGGKYAQKGLTNLVSKAVSSGVKKAAGKAAVQAGVKVAAEAAVEVCAATVGAEAGAAAGTGLAPGVGTLIGLVVGLIIGAVFGLLDKFFKWMKKNGQDFLFGSVALVAYGSFIGSPILIYSGLGVGTLSILNGGLSGLGKGFFRLSHSVIGLMTSIVLPAIGTPLLIGLLATPLAIAIIIFIINAGAYIVPPSEVALSESPYIDVIKTASPGGPFQNGNIPLTVEYTITIIAKKGTLTNIRPFDDANECKVIKKGSSPGCPPISGTIPSAPQEISPTQPFSFKYSMTFGSSTYFDSAIVDTFTVTADSPEQKGAKASGGASVIIGNPPIGCFTFDNSWDADKKAKELAAIAQLSQATTYMATLCAAGNITLTYNGDPSVNYGGEIINGGITIYHHGLDLGLTGAVHTITHESGHIYAGRTDAYAKYLDDAGAAAERPICTYPFNPHKPSEDFAEMIAIYVARRAPTINAACLTNFKTQYPNHWRFARYNIFYEDLGW